MEIINLWGGPGAGKSTTAAGLFFEMKKRQIKVELVTEYAKDMTWEKRHNVLSDQLYILAKQNRRIQRLEGQVDWVITDSPLPLGLVYTPDSYFKTFEALVMELWDSYRNHSFLINRDFEYQPEGRNQTAEQALGVDHTLMKLLGRTGIAFHQITNDPHVDRIMQIMSIVGLNTR